MPKLARLQSYRQKNTNKRSLKRIVFWTLLPILFCILIYFPLRTKYWDGKNKLNLVVNGMGENIVILSFDPKLNEINSIIIPGNTQVEVSRNLGTYQLKNVWQIGDNEKIGGELLSGTVAKNFYAPVYLWADKGAQGFGKGFIPSIKSSITPYKTNLSIGDKIRIGIFSLFVKNTNNVVIDLSKTSFLAKSKLVDGDYGFVVSLDIPTEYILSLSRPESISASIQIGLNNYASVAFEENIIKIFEVMGLKVSSIQRGKVEDLGCEVSGQNKELVLETSKIFKCSVNGKQSDFDVELTIGSQFDKKF